MKLEEMYQKIDEINNMKQKLEREIIKREKQKEFYYIEKIDNELKICLSKLNRYMNLESYDSVLDLIQHNGEEYYD